MTRLSHRDRSEVPGLEVHFDAVEDRMGFLPNSQLVMAHKPLLVEAFAAMRAAVYDADGATPQALLSLVGAVASMAAGCRYCTAHSASNAARRAVPDDKLADLWTYETSSHFTEAERAALRFAQAAVFWYGFLNRFNDSLATTLEDEPHGFAGRTLARSGWTAGKHGRAAADAG